MLESVINLSREVSRKYKFIYVYRCYVQLSPHLDYAYTMLSSSLLTLVLTCVGMQKAMHHLYGVTYQCTITLLQIREVFSYC